MGRNHVKNKTVSPETPVRFDGTGIPDPTSKTALTEKHFSGSNCIRSWN